MSFQQADLINEEEVQTDPSARFLLVERRALARDLLEIIVYVVLPPPPPKSVLSREFAIRWFNAACVIDLNRSLVSLIHRSSNKATETQSVKADN